MNLDIIIKICNHLHFQLLLFNRKVNFEFHVKKNLQFFPCQKKKKCLQDRFQLLHCFGMFCLLCNIPVIETNKKLLLRNLVRMENVEESTSI